MIVGLFTLAAVIVAVTAQCGPADNARCATWVQGGFCTSNYYTEDYRKATCGSVCNLCPTTAAAACVGTTENANCASWKTNGFCQNPAYTDAMKRSYCCKTCFAPVAPTTTTTPQPPPITTCAVVYENTTEVVNAVPATTPAAALNYQTSITKVFVKSGCTLKLYTDPMGSTAAAGSPFAGADAFVTLAGDAMKSLSYECTCP